MYEWRSHTAEIELAIEAAAGEEGFTDALAAFAELVVLERAGAEDEQRAVAIEAPDRASLLVEWLQELIFLADSESFVAERANDVGLGPGSLKATLIGRRTEFEPLVKAATYHGLKFAREGDMWQARVVLDV